LKKLKKNYEITGKKESIFRIEHKNQNKEIPFLGRVIYGDMDAYEKKFYLKED